MSALSDELATSAYDNMTNDEVTVALNAPSRPIAVPASDVRRYLLLANRWPAISLAASGLGTYSDSARLAAIAIVDALDNFSDFDLQDAQVAAAVDARLSDLLAEGFIDAANKSTILALGNNRQSRARELGLGVVPFRHVAASR